MAGETRRIVAIAAALGSEVDFEVLRRTALASPQHLDDAMAEAFDAGILIRSRSHSNADDRPATTFAQFVHDRVRQAAYGLLDPATRDGLHWHIGQTLVQGDESDATVFAAVDHLNKGRRLATTESQRVELARRNRTAADKALAAGAKDSAYDYAIVGIEALGGDWEHESETMSDLCFAAAQAAYLSGRFDDMESHLRDFEERCVSATDIARASEIRIQALTIANRARDALEAGMQALRRLDVDLPEEPSPGLVAQGMAELATLLGDRTIESLATLPRMTDPRHLAASAILSALASPAHIANPALFPFIVMRHAALSMEHGLTATSPVAFALMAMLISANRERLDDGYRFGQLALRLLDIVDAQRYRAMVVQLVAIGPRHLKEPLRDILPSLREAYETGLEVGDLPYAGYSGHQVCIHTYFAGLPVSEVALTAQEINASLATIRQETALQWNRMYEQAALNLLGRSTCPFLLQGRVFDGEAELPGMIERNNRSGIASLHVLQLHLAVLHGEYEVGREQARKAESYLDGLVGLLHIPLYHAFDALAHVCALPAGAGIEEGVSARIEHDLDVLRTLAAQAPFHHRHRIALIEAELARVRGDDEGARAGYDEASRLAAASDYVQDRSLAHERAARFFGAKGLASRAEAHWGEARRGWARWGAASKIRQLEGGMDETRIARSLPPEDGSSTGLGVPEVDVAAIVRAAAALSGEIVLDSLLKRVLTTVVENAGAERGFLFIDGEGKLTVEARVDPTSPDSRRQDLEQVSDTVCAAIVNLVARTRQPLVLADAQRHGAFVHDPCVQRRQIRSVLCLPIEARGRLLGIVYLENNLAAGIFTASRVTLLSILAVQAAVAVENARLYAELEREVDKRTIELRRANERLQAEVRVRSEAEAALRESRERFSAFMEYLPAPAFLKDARGVVVYVNRRFEEVMGTGWVGRTAFDHLPRSVAESMESDDRAALEVGVVQRAETVVDARGQVREFETTKFPIRIPGRPPEVGGLSLDMTDRKRTEEALRYAQKMESLGVLAGGVAHDFNNLLTGIMGNITIALDELPPSDATECLDDALVSAGRAAELAQQMLAYSGRGRFVLEPIRLPDVIRNSIRLFGIGSKSVRIDLELQAPAPPVLADRGQIEQLIVNLVTNATEALGHRSGVVEIRTSSIRIDAADTRYSKLTATTLTPGSYAVLDVADDGPGMDDDTLEKIFEPFFTTKFTGRGLGLPVVLGIVRGHAGGLEVRSAPGRGTNVRVVLPAIESGAFVETSSEKGVRRKTVMVIDDEPAVLRVSKRVLERAGHLVIEATDGEAGVAVFQRGKDIIDAVVLDLSMPGMGGPEVLAELKRLRPEIRVLVISGFGPDEVARRLEGNPPWSVLRKPFRPTELLEALEPILGE